VKQKKIVCEAAKAMMCDQDLPTLLWKEASSTIFYVQNRCSHVILEEKTPKEVFISEKPKI
jgi:hypothetical protein